jgi:hypothetical protein
MTMGQGWRNVRDARRGGWDLPSTRLSEYIATIWRPLSCVLSVEYCGTPVCCTWWMYRVHL